MSNDSPSNDDLLEKVRRQALEIEDLRARLNQLEGPTGSPTRGVGGRQASQILPASPGQEGDDDPSAPASRGTSDPFSVIFDLAEPNAIKVRVLRGGANGGEASDDIVLQNPEQVSLILDWLN